MIEEVDIQDKTIRHNENLFIGFLLLLFFVLEPSRLLVLYVKGILCTSGRKDEKVLPPLTKYTQPKRSYTFESLSFSNTVTVSNGLSIKNIQNLMYRQEIPKQKV